MELGSLQNLLFHFLFLSLVHLRSDSQQVYPNDPNPACSSNSSRSKGYLCNGPQTSCQSFVTFRSVAPYDSPERIASLLGSIAYSIASINNLSSTGTGIPQNKLMIIPVTCSCFGNIYEHQAPYTVKKNDTYYLISRAIYQGLTSCESMINRNYYDIENIPVGAELMVPVRCACPSGNQSNHGVTSLVTYMPREGENLTKIGELFGGVSPQSITEANINLQEDSIRLSIPILVPLTSESCSLRPTSFFCRCPNGQFGFESEQGAACAAGRQDSKGFPVKLVIILGVGIGVGFLSLVLFGHYLFIWLKKRKAKMRRERFFNQNGGFLLRQQMSSSSYSNESTKLFTAEELKKATDNYNPSRILGQGGFGTVYKGMLLDGSIVAVKRSRAVNKGQINQFINEVVILSQINHRNVVKLLGCCLETELPLLVYEFIPNGSLFHHIHKKGQDCSLSWEHRLRIACQVAGAIAYMHSSASIPIFHRDIKTSNILLDDQYDAKVSDFGTSRSIPVDKTHLTTAVQGTFGYLDPEYFQSGQFTDKSDVYSFGVVLIELMTGEKPVSFATDPEEDRNLVAKFISAMSENTVLQMLDHRVATEAGKEDVLVLANVATRCLRLNGRKRPTMKEVAIELEGLRKLHRCIDIDETPELQRDEGSFPHTVVEPTQESIENSTLMEMETISI